MTELTILMPCLNEAETLEVCIRKAQEYLSGAGLVGEILISDNGSTDGSQSLAESLGARVVHAPQRGYGGALLAGIDAAKGRYIIMADSDDSYDFSHLAPFVSALRGGAELVMGNRFKGGIAKNAMPPLHRYLGNPVLSTIGRVLYQTPVGDFHCGLRGFSKQAIQRLGLNSTGMDFASEMVIKATLFGLRIEEVPTTLSPDGRSRPPHLRSWRDGWLHLKLLLTLAPFWMFFYPGLALAGIGGGVFTLLMWGPVRIGTVNFDIATLVFASAAILAGVQMIWFYLLGNLFAVRFKLLPETSQFAALRKQVTVDNACKVGAVLLLLSILFTIGSVAFWGASGFGDLDPSIIVRAASLVVVSASLGVQSITSGFLWGLLEQRVAVEHESAGDTLPYLPGGSVN
ncbi:glycosyltransferase family 2 protein [Yoonia sp. MH D7]